MDPAEQHEKNQPKTDGESRNQVLRGGAGNEDKIRDILFGTQMRDYESRFARLEEALIKETVEIRDTNRRRFDQVDGYIKKEIEALQSRIKSECDDRSDTAGRQSRELKELGESLGRRLRDLDDRASGAERSLRDDLMQQAKNLTEEARARHDEITSLLERHFQELREGKTDRKALGALFHEVSLRLNDEFTIPGTEV